MGEKTFWQKLKEQLYLRLWVARKTTYAAIALEATEITLHQLEILQLPPAARIAVGVVATLLAAHKGSATLPAKPGTAPPAPSRVNPALLLLLAAGLVLGAPAFAQEEAAPSSPPASEATVPAPTPDPVVPDIAFGGCVATKKLGAVCAGPAASLAVLKYEDGRLLTGFTVGGGYGLSIFTERFYSIGLSLQALHSVSNADEPLTAAGMLCIAKYLRVGVGRGGTVLLALGVGG